MTGAELKQLREDLGEAIGRPLSVGDMAKLCGLPPETNVASADAAPVPNEACTPSTLAGFLRVTARPFAHRPVSNADARGTSAELER